MKKRLLMAAAALALAAPAVWAVPFDYIRVGDLDGFGFTSTAGLQRTTGAAADTNGNGLLQQTEFLPDINHNGSVATGSGDDYDHRSAAEKANTAAPTGNGFTNTGSSGSKWTDITLSTSFTGSDFPDAGGVGTPNQPTLIFDFNVGGSAVVLGTQLFFNLVFGDYDVVPANITLTFAAATGAAARTVTLTTQSGAADGLIQAASALLNFNEVFTSDGAGGFNGYVKVDFIAPNEPYMVFDFTELSVTRIATGVPVAPTLPLVTLALGALAWSRRRAVR